MCIELDGMLYPIYVLHVLSRMLQTSAKLLIIGSSYRTGRAGQKGKAITFFTDHEKSLAGSLIAVLKGANQPVPEELMKFGTTIKKKEHSAYGAFYREDAGSGKKATKITFD